MVFVLTVSALAAAAAALGDAGLRRLGLPSRWIWLASLAAAPVLLATSLAGLGAPGSEGAAGALGPVPVVEIPGVVLGAASPGADAAAWLVAVEAGLLALWIASALALVGTLAAAHRALRRERRGWEPTRVLGRPVLVAADRGPAVAGLRTGWIVLPAWALELPDDHLHLVLAHEEEHLRARDPLLLALALGLLLPTAWNPVAWWQLRRLRAATEVDCDRRVLARHPDRRRYGASLLAVAGRASGPSLALAAFSERTTSLERRILAMSRPNRRWTRTVGALLLLLAALVGVQACGVDGPGSTDAGITGPNADVAAPEVAPEVAPAEEGPASDAVVDVPEEVEVPQPNGFDPQTREPTFTPFTVAPSIRNRREVVEAMNAEYPPLLREAGVGGTVRVYFFIGEEGRVEHTRIDQSSGHEALDEAALRVASVYRFSPALNRDEPVPVWVSFPITFQAEVR
jgi:TonB family protein